VVLVMTMIGSLQKKKKKLSTTYMIDIIK
jgi:hypothetical protein